jgi:hypothetical protein
VTLARHLHVGVFVVDNAGGAAGVIRDERGHHRGDRGLRFLAAEAAAHAFADADDFVMADAEHLGDNGLDFGRVLRRGVDDDLALFAGVGKRGLRLEIKLLLAADVERAAEAVGRGGEDGGCVARGDAARDAEVALLGDRLFEVEERFLFGDVELDCGESASEGFARFGGDQRDGLADVEQVLVREERFVDGEQAVEVVPGDVGDREDGYDAGDGAGGGGIDAVQRPGGDG